MAPIARITEATRERIAEEFDTRGPEVCMAEILTDLKRNNPELLDIASRCAASLGNAPRAMQAFGMFYRLITHPWPPADAPCTLSPLPRVTPETRDRLVAAIDRDGSEAFVLGIIAQLERENPDLLRALYSLASQLPDPFKLTQGLALFYQAVAMEAAGSRAASH